MLKEYVVFLDVAVIFVARGAGIILTCRHKKHVLNHLVYKQWKASHDVRLIFQFPVSLVNQFE